MTDFGTLVRVVLQGWALAATLMAALWVVHLVIKNAAVIDVGWAVSLPLLAAFDTWRLGGGARGWLLTALVAVWGLRLAGYLLLVRVIGHPEEGRYVQMRREWHTHVAAKFLRLFETEALVAVVLSLPFLLVAAHGGKPGLLE